MKNLFKILCIFTMLLALNVSAQEVRFIHITDIELTKTNAYKLQKTIKEINTFDDIDFVVFGGNNISKPTQENLNIFLHLLKKLNKKHYVLLGSSDVSTTKAISKEYYLDRISKTRYTHSKKPNYAFEKKGYLFVVMDGSKQHFQSTNGYYNKNELLWLEKTLNKHKDKQVIILQHFPLLEASSKWIETAKMEDYQELLSKYDNVKVIVSGHYDINDEIKKDGMVHILTENYSKAGAYKTIEIDLENNFIGTYLIKD